LDKVKKFKTFIWEEKIHRLRSIKKNDRIYSSQNANNYFNYQHYIFKNYLEKFNIIFE